MASSTLQTSVEMNATIYAFGRDQHLVNTQQTYWHILMKVLKDVHWTMLFFNLRIDEISVLM